MNGVLVGGFEPFGPHEVNPSQLLAEQLGGVVLPVSYARAATALRDALEARAPEVVLLFGLADDRTSISVERFAHNLDEASTTDNDAAAGSGAEIEPGGPLACRSTLPVDAIVAALREEEIPAEVSRDAGGFLCNHTFYVLMRTLGRDQIGGFVHVPPLDVLPFETLLRAAHVAELKSAPHVVELDDVDGLEILAVALNPLDLAVANGVFYGGHPPLPYVPGCEAVARAGDGGHVYLFGEGRGSARDGFMTERVDAPEAVQLRLPDGVDPSLAAAAGIAGIAAWVPVAWKAKVGEGDRVLVLGGTGSVGRMAAQAAELLGAATVVAVGSKELDRIPEAFGDDGFTVCIDPVWGEPLADALQYAQRHARVVHVGQSAGPQAPLRSADVRGKELVVMGHSNFALSKDERDRAYLELLDHLVAGRIRLDYETFPLDDVAAAWQNQRGGKSVVVF